MYLQHLALTHFRNYTRLEIDLSARISVFQGDNAQGKTNLLEAIYYLATTRSPLASSDRQLIGWVADREVMPFARLETLFTRGGQDHTIEMTLVKEPQADANGATTSFRRQIRLDGLPRRAFDTVGTLNVVLFLPEDIRLVAGGPAGRRRYLDITLCQMERHYCRSLSRYNRVVRQRNALLRQIRAGQARASQLPYWDEQLSSLGAYLLSRRLWAVAELARQAQEINLALTGDEERLELSYQSSIMERLPGFGPYRAGQVVKASTRAGDALSQSDMKETFLGALGALRGEEIGRAVTLVGPHRDDLRFLVNDRDATVFGSRGQQRTIVLSLKLAEVQLMHDQTGEMPVLLLDDVISELDQHRAQFLLRRLSRAQQVLVTTTNLGCFSHDFLSSAVLWRIADDSIAPYGQLSPRGE